MHSNNEATPAQSKAAVRAAVRAARALRAGTQEALLDDVSLAAHCLTWIRSVTAGVPRPLVAAYSPLPAEPGGEVLLSTLADAGVDLLLPVVVSDTALAWARFEPGDETTTGSFGIAEPTGPRKDSAVLAKCDALLLPALGVDQRGMRLGQGAGYYDRALPHAGDRPCAALIYDAELVSHLPAEPHDHPIGAAITPSGVHTFSAR